MRRASAPAPVRLPKPNTGAWQLEWESGSKPPLANWSYNAAANAIDFLTTTTPGAGQNLTVTYRTACF